ncbi:Fc.00g006860.m01.CDS01 [Cosmosporella sp. VM-42]
MAAPNSSDYELLTEHFGYPPVSLLDDIINTVNVLADRALDSVERLLLSIPPQNLGFTASRPSKSKSSKDNDAETPLPPEEAAKLEIENGTHQLETLLNASIDKNFDLFELYTMRNILTVRPNDQPFMRLSHYDGLDFAPVADRPTAESVTALRRRLQASQKLHVALEAERARNDALLGKLRSALGVKGQDVKMEDGAEEGTAFGFLGDKGGLEEGGSEKPITTTTEFTLSQLQALRALSTSLRTILPDLGPEDVEQGTGAESKKTWRRDRVGYIEGNSRKYLENSRGLELGAQGEVRDGEWQSEGRKFTRGEVEGLEQVISMLDEGKRGRKDGDGDEAMGES